MALFQAALQIEQFWANFITSKGCVLTTVNLKITVNPAGDSLYRYNVLSILPSQVYEVCKCINCSRKADAEKVAHTVLEKVSHPPPNNYAAQFNGQKEKIIQSKIYFIACLKTSDK